MNWEVELIKKLQAAGGAFTDAVMYFFTQTGGELFFIFVAALLYWCVDKRQGYKFINVFVLGQLLVGGLKALVKRPRPYTLDGISAIKERTSGYSFPSGHSQNITNMAAQLSIYSYGKGKSNFLPVFVIGVALSILVPFSRVYLGQHYPTDVITGGVLGLAVGIVGYYLFDLLKNKEENIAFVIAPLCVIITVVSLIIGGSRAGEVIKVCGVYSAATVGYFIEKRRVAYAIPTLSPVKAIIKILIGISVLLLIKEGLKAVFTALLTDGSVPYLLLNEFFRYFLIGIWAITVCPAIYKKLKI